jgi:valyl-tRNA synthetase
MYFPRVTQYDWKLQTSEGYIIRILQHFATKLWNITNFVMLFQAVIKFLSRLVEI